MDNAVIPLNNRTIDTGMETVSTETIEEAMAAWIDDYMELTDKDARTLGLALIEWSKR